MKRMTIRAAALACALILGASILSSCGAAAPYGTFALSDAEKYKTGVADAIFAVPDSYRVTLSTNMIAAVGENDSFSLQCRQSDYYYNDLEKNYAELKSQLVGLYGDYAETSKKAVKAAGYDALEVRYDLTVSGEKKSFVQILFYKPKTGWFRGANFYLFTYTAPENAVNEELLSAVAATISLDKKAFRAPEGFVAVDAAAASSLVSDRYELYCPDHWNFDASLGQIAMRVPDNSAVVTLVEIETAPDLDAYAAAYAAENAAGLDAAGQTGLRLYIAAAVFRMAKELPSFRLKTNGTEKGEVKGNEAASRLDDYLDTYKNEAGIVFDVIEFTADMPRFDAHERFYRSGSTTEDPTAETVRYRVRQFFCVKDGRLYFFTYTAYNDKEQNAQKDDFNKYLDDALKAVKYFKFK